MAVALPRDVLEERQRDIARRIRACPEPSSPAFRALQDFLANDLVGTIGGLLGMWHNHPDGDVPPSDGDLSTALRLRDEYGLSQFVALILPTGEDAWAAPPLAAWAVRRSPSAALCTSGSRSSRGGVGSKSRNVQPPNPQPAGREKLRAVGSRPER